MVAMGLAGFAGAATACYGLAVAIRPAVLLRPCGWTEDDPAARALARMTACRDIVSGLGMALAPTPAALRVATGCRVLADLSDAVVLAAALRDRPQRTKAVAVAAGWGLLCGTAGLTASRTR
ncbi:hypothetical protein [Nocardia grenadensis]|uniref:hypothetical protein n=1 Tax=Nocardia grenadensis TaxID=931537 RepID=UPI0007A4F2CB|nr:hypothetical protein [Nocardia grenadensis]